MLEVRSPVLNVQIHKMCLLCHKGNISACWVPSLEKLMMKGPCMAQNHNVNVSAARRVPSSGKHMMNGPCMALKHKVNVLAQRRFPSSGKHMMNGPCMALQL